MERTRRVARSRSPHRIARTPLIARPKGRLSSAWMLGLHEATLEAPGAREPRGARAGSHSPWRSRDTEPVCTGILEVEGYP